MTAVGPSTAAVAPPVAVGPSEAAAVIHYAVVDAGGNILAWYNTDLYPPNADGSPNALIPSGVVQLTDAQWRDCVNNNGLRQIVNGAPVAYAPPATPTQIQSISSRQFFQQLAATPTASSASATIITQAEAIAALSGTMPSELQALINALPAAQQFPATMKILGAGSYLLNDPVTQTLAQAFGWTPAETAAFWTAASQL